MRAISSTAILVVLTLASAPAIAGQRQRQPRDGQGAAGQSGDGQSQTGRAVPRGDAPSQPAAPSRPAASAPQRVAPQRIEPRRTEPRRTEPQRAEAPRTASRNRAPENRPAVGRAIPRTEPPRVRDNGNRGNGGFNGSRFDNRRRGNRPIILTPRYYHSGRYFSAPFRGYRPYYFRPRMSLPYFGVHLGYTVPYSYVYSSPVSVYGYGRPATPVMIGPGPSYYGGVSLEIAPSHAEVFVDGEYVGWVEDFDGTMQPLTLTPGNHRIEIFAPGYEALVLDVVVRPGEVVPYRGSLLPHKY